MNNTSKLPNFLVVGAPKCGTTSMYHYLRQHPDIFLPTTKELHYFSYHQLLRNDRGPGDSAVFGSLCATASQYEAHYEDVRGEAGIGEISPSYLYYSSTAAQILDTLGQVNIIVMLRNPIDKAFSQYMHLVRENREQQPFYEALLSEKDRIRDKWSDLWRYAESSLYSEKLQDFIDAFGRDRVKVVFFEDFTQDVVKSLKEVTRFLGVAELDSSANTDRRYNRTGVPRSRLVAGFLAKENRVKSLVKKLLPESARVTLREQLINLNTGDKLKMEPRERRYLCDYFREDVNKLAQMLQRDPPWTLD